MAAKLGFITKTRVATALTIAAATTIALWASAETGPAPIGPAGSSSAAGTSAAPTAPNAGATAQPTVGPAPSAEGEIKAKCVAAFESYQDLRQAGALVQAQRETLSCAQPECPDVIKAKCSEWAHELKSLVPSVVFTGADSDGAPLTDVTVQLDGKVVAAGLDGKPHLLDPGPHHVHYERAGSAPVDQDITVRSGEQSRKLVAKFLTAAKTKTAAAGCAAGSAAGSEGTSGVWPVAWVGFSVGGTGIIIGAVAGILELTNVSKIQDACDTQGCTETQIDNTASVADVATASFVVGGVGLVTGIIAAIVASTSSDEPAADTKRAAVSVQPLLGAGFAGVQGRF